MDREGFTRKVGVPVLIWQAPKVAGPFSWGQTQSSGGLPKEESARNLLRKGNLLPVLPLRPRADGNLGEVRLGRATNNDVVLADETISSNHALFQRNDRTGSYQLIDQGSRNGSRVNGRIALAGRAVILFDSDLLELGDSLVLFFYPAGLYQVLRGLA